MPQRLKQPCNHAADPSGPGYGLSSPVVMAQMEGREMPHTEVQQDNHWEMYIESPQPSAPE